MPLTQEIASALHDIVQREIDKADVGLLIAFREVRAKMVDGRKLLVVIDFREVAVVENRPAIGRGRFGWIVIDEPRLAQTQEEIGVNLLDFFLQQTLQKIESPPPTNITPALTARSASRCRRFSPFEQTASPCRLFLKVKQLPLFVGDRPANRARTHIQSDAVVALDIPQIHAHQPLPSVLQCTCHPLPVRMTLRVKIRLCQKCPSGRHVGGNLTCRKPQ